MFILYSAQFHILERFFHFSYATLIRLKVHGRWFLFRARVSELKAQVENILFYITHIKVVLPSTTSRSPANKSIRRKLSIRRIRESKRRDFAGRYSHCDASINIYH